MKDFVHLHNHSEYSLLDGMSSPEEIVSIAKKHDQTAIALTDHGNMGGTLRLQEAAQKAGIKAIHGCEFYYVPSLVADTEDKKAERFHLIVLAKNDDGLEKLYKLQQKAWTQGFYYKPRIEWDDLEYVVGDVVVLSGCMASHLCRLLERGEETEAEQLVGAFHQRFGDDYYVELQPWNVDGLNTKLCNLGDAHNVRVVGTIDCHYPTLSDKGFEESLLMMGQMPGLNAGDDRYAKEQAGNIGHLNTLEKINHLYPNRKLRFDAHENYVMSGNEVEEAFQAVGVIRDVYTNTLEVADKCNATIPTGRTLLPKFSKKLDSQHYLRELAEFGLQEAGFSNDPEYVERLNHELEIINDLGFNNYFLIVWDIYAYAAREGIYCSPGRGSSAGSLVAMCLGITKVDPIKFKLLFSRFINPSRVSWPDIDMDWPDKDRPKMQEYVKERWGEENVASISTYGEFKPKSVVKSAARIFQVPFDRMNKLTPLFENLSELKSIPQGRAFLSDYPHVYDIAERLENRIQTAGHHAAGVVIADRPLWQICPIETRKDLNDERCKVTAFTMDEVEKLGLLKFDFLGLKALAVIDDCIKKIEERHDIAVDASSLALDDHNVCLRFNTDSLVGIFQAEGVGYRKLIADMGIDNFADIAASNALVRPGAWVVYGKTFIDCKRNGREPQYPHEITIPILEETHGAFVYQEQTMLVAQVLAGFTEGEADSLRKVIAKKGDVADFLPYYEKWMDGCQKFISREKAQEIWNSIEVMASYSFPKSHAVAYGMISYQTMWLKHYYPTEFIWSCLTNETKNEDISTFLSEAGRLGVDILPPDINDSDASFSMVDNSIRFGLSNVSGCGPGGIKEILAKRPFRDFDEFREKCAKNKVRTNLVENLEKVGAFRDIGHDPGYDIEKYFLPILNWTHYAEQDTSYQDVLSLCADVEDNNGYHIIRAIVKGVKRKPHYFRVEFEDSSGTLDVFSDDKQADVKKKDYLLAIVGRKSLIAFCDANSEDDPLIQHINDQQNFVVPPEVEKYDLGSYLSGKYLCQLLSARSFKTKAGKMMANVTVWEPKGARYERLVMFPQTYINMAKKLKKWEWVVVRAGDKYDIIEGMVTLEEFIKIRENNA